MRLIDGDALIEKFNKKVDMTERLIDARTAERFATFCVLADAVEEAQTVDAVPVVHGRFVHDGPRFAGGVDWWHCSSCGRLASGIETRFDYCPHCGARMDSEETDNG